MVPGMCGYVEDGIIPGLFGYEAGQSCVGDIFAWFVENCVPAAYRAPKRKHAAWTCTSCWRRKPPSRNPARAACWRSTGGTATARCWWMWT